MGGGQSQTTNETKEIRLPPWVEAASQENYNFAKDVANRPYKENPYEMVAGLDPLYYAARKKLGTLDDYQSNYAASSKKLKDILGFNPADISKRSVEAPTMKNVDIQSYMNPMTSIIERNAIRNMSDAAAGDQTRLAADATKSGGMGGSRQAIQQAVQGAKSVQAIGDTSAKIRGDSFDRATALAQTDLQRQYEAAVQTGNWQQAAEIQSRAQELEAHGQTIQASGELRQTADAAQAARMNEIAQYLGLGSIAQQQKQREGDLRANKWQKKWDYPLEQLNILLASLGMSPYGHTETGTSTTKSSGGGAGQALGAGLGLLQMFAGLSDRDEKTNIELLDDSGPVPVYAYDYKADVKRAKKRKRPMGPKRVGPMAQDVEKLVPAAVRKVGGKRVIDLSSLAEA